MKKVFKIENSNFRFNDNHKIETGFLYSILEKGEMKEKAFTDNTILIVVKGEIKLHFNGNIEIVKSNEFILIPQKTDILYKVLKNCRLLTFSFHNSQISSQLLKSICLTYKKENTSLLLSVRYPLVSYINLLITYIETGLDCKDLIGVKQEEFFILLNEYYSTKEISNFLFPIMQQVNGNFKVLT